MRIVAYSIAGLLIALGVIAWVRLFWIPGL
jgi:hypothetical protein